jgi:hypothetical protein
VESNGLGCQFICIVFLGERGWGKIAKSFRRLTEIGNKIKIEASVLLGDEDALLFSLDGLIALSDVSLALGDEARELGQLLALIGELGHQLMSQVAQL